MDLTNLSPERREQYDEWPHSKRRYHSKCFLPAERLKLTYLIVNKCGTTSSVKNIRDTHSHECMDPEEYLKKFPEFKVVAMWRDPYKRVESTYRWAVMVQPPVKEFFPDYRAPFEDWVQVLCSEPIDSWYDLHLCSQTYHNMHPLGRMPDILIPWDWKRLWSMFRVHRPSEPMNTSDQMVPTPWSAENREMFSAWAAEDIAIWNSLHEVR